MKKILFFIFLTAFLNISFFAKENISYAHAFLPEEVIEYLKENEDISREEFDAFLVKTYGNSILDEMYWDPISVSPEEFESIPEEFAPSVQEFKAPTRDEQFQDIKDDVEMILALREETNKPFSENAKDFFIMGIEHIVFGFDHVLFVISLLLAFLPWRKILLMVTIFTVSHSITFLLAGNQVLTLSPSIVEPIIALSIAYMAITTVFFKHIPFFKAGHSSMAIIFLFGLFHGLGFAGVFAELNIPTQNYISSLLFFNIGIEAGQVIIILLALPLLYIMRKDKYSIKILAACIAALALYWAIERIFL